jgi:hypothetical protein
MQVIPLVASDACASAAMGGCFASAIALAL